MENEILLVAESVSGEKDLPKESIFEAIEQALGKKAVKELLPLQPGDVPETYADTSKLAKNLGYQPSTPMREGVKQFVQWYLNDFQKLDQ